ncbi:hypothetical protein Trydic_g21872 [Trypoxylus dichotomus]
MIVPWLTYIWLRLSVSRCFGRNEDDEGSTRRHPSRRSKSVARVQSHSLDYWGASPAILMRLGHDSAPRFSPMPTRPNTTPTTPSLLRPPRRTASLRVPAQAGVRSVLYTTAFHCRTGSLAKAAPYS